MRYPIWAFFFVLVLPPFTLHALYTGSASTTKKPTVAIASAIFVTQLSPAPIPQPVYWSHTSVTRD